MKHLRLLVVMTLSLLTFASTWADDIPYRKQRREIFRQLPVNENSIVFLGNSITDFGLWSEFFGSDANIINRGIQGIESPEVLEHLSLIGSGHPQKLFLMIGINDYKTPERVVPNIRKMIDLMQRESPQTTLYVQSILPCNMAERASEPVSLNPQIRALCEEKGITYIDVYGAMTAISGNTSMPSNMTDDSLHPNALGYREWCKLIASYIGKPSAIAETGTPQKPLSRAIYNSLLTEYQMVPVNDGDILHVGDYQVMTGEWAELMGMPSFKNRGLGGGYGWSMSLDEFNSAYRCLIKGNPSKIFFQCGKRALDDKPTDISSLVAKYKSAVANIQSVAPNAEIYLESIIPNADASINTTSIVPFNAEIKAIADESTSDKVFFVDVYAALVDNGKLATRYQGANTEQSRGINGRGYVAWANALKPYVEGAAVRANMTDAQSALSEATWDALDKVWAHSGTKSYAALRQAISEAQALIASGTATDDACATMQAALAAAEATGDNASPTSADALPGSDHLMPAPQQLQKGTGSPFALNRPVKVENDFTDTELLNEILAELGCTENPTATAIVKVNQVSAIAGADEPTLAGFENETYKLAIDGNTITIDAISRLGVIRAAQTIQQLAEADGGHAPTLEGLTITDWPAFKVRGFMHDVGRSFITVEELEKQIKLYSRFKVNVFQWHMTENQAWRFEVTKHPELTQASNMTRFAGSYYSQADCRKIDALAHKYGIYVIPEIDMPGHSQAFTRATGVNMQSDAGIAILKDALDDCISTFTHAPYIHIGGDEVSITYTDFLNIMTDYIHNNSDKRVMWWNTCAGTGTTHKLINPATDHCDMAQCWASSGTQIKGFPCIDCRYNYTNHFDVFADLVGMYRSNIFYKQHGDAETAGFISCPWNDRKTPTQDDIIEQNNVYAVTIATGERAWRGGGKQYIEQCGAVLPNNGDEYEEFKNWEQRFLFHKAHSLQNEPIPYVKQTNVRWRISDPISNGGNAATTFSQWEDCKALNTDMPTSVTVSGQKYGWNLATGAGIYLNHTWPTAVPGIWGKNIASNQTVYAYTYIYNEGTERTVGAQIEFQNYGRSENDAAPAAGQWDRKGSRIWWNGTEIAAPNWKNAGRGIDSEVDLQDENFPAREPVQLTLKQGWNKVFIKLPYVNSGCRLNKWLYTFVLTDLEGKNAIDGLVYSPTKTLSGDEPDPSSEIDYSPLISDEHSSYYYSLKTPGRDNRYATSKGANADMVGETATTDASFWKFVRRSDGDLDIINYADQTYVSPTADNNSALHTQATSPDTGWQLKPAATKGYFIIVSGETEWNQTKSGQGYKIYNWGYGSKTTGEYNYDDGGCQYEIRINEELTTEDYTYVGVEPGKTYTITNIQKNSSQFPLYVDGNNNLCIGNSGQDYGTSAQYVVEGHKGKVAFKNVATGQYLVWKGKSGGTNGNKGTLGTYDATYCDWTLTASTNSTGNYWIWANRDNGTPGALMIKNDKTWDAYSNEEGWLDAYSNVYKFTEVPTEEFPKPSTSTTSYWYTLKGDRDSGRYVTATNVSAGMMSATALDGEEHADYWKFEKRNDGTYDIINRKYNCYVTPDATNNTQLTTSATRPTNGWTITPSAVEGKYLITNTNASGAVQMHVCNGGNSYKIFNWGGGSNTSGGCNFTIEYVEETLASFPLASDETVQHWYTFKDKRGSKYTRAQGVATGMVGNTALDNTDHSDCWKFVKRDDGTYDIINFKYDCYIATGAANNTQLQTSQTRPQTGWIVTETAEPGFYIITNEGGNKVQLHQATSANVLNWGYDSTGFAGAFNNTDQGCLFGISEVEGLVPSTADKYTINCIGLPSGITGGVCYERDNYPAPKATLTATLNKNALIAMHVSGYKGSITSIEDNVITVTYTTAADTDPVLWDDNDNNTSLPAPRIPALVKTADGTLLAFSDWRYNRNDIGRGDKNGHIDIEVRRSTDGGQTWSPAIIAAKGSGIAGSTDAGYGDAAVVADHTTANSQKVLLLAAAGYYDYPTANRSNSKPSHVGKFVSNDGGQTWSEGVDIQEAIYAVLPSSVVRIFATSGKITQASFKAEGAEYNRIYTALCTNGGNYIIYSDDFGTTWKLLGSADVAPQPNGNEAHVTELPSGDLLLDSRCEAGGRLVNIFTYSDKNAGTGTWGTTGSKMGMGAAGCNGDIDVISAYKIGSDQPVDVLVQTAPRNGRNHVQYYYKEMPTASNGHYNLSDFTSGWTAGYVVFDGSSAYSSIVNDGAGSEYMLYERNETGNTFDYDMVFEKHDIALITNGNYFKEVPGEPRTISYTLTDAAGNVFKGAYQGYEGILPVLNGTSYSLTNQRWEESEDGLTLTATIVFPFRTSSNAVTVWNGISAFNGTAFYFYAKDDTFLYVTKDATADTDRHKWAIYPSLTGDRFTFTVKNKQYGTYISTASTGDNHTAGTVKLAGEGTAFTYADGGLLTTLSTPKYLSVASATPTDEKPVGTWGSHNGTKLKFTVLETEEASFHQLQQQIDAIAAHIAAGEIGYPQHDAATSVALLSYKDGGVNAGNMQEATAALNAIYTEPLVNLPVAGRAYRIALNCSNPNATVKKYYIAASGNPVAEASSAATFIVGYDGSSDKPFFFIVKDGSHYLNFQGATTTPANYSASYNNFSLEALAASTSSGIGADEAYNAQHRFGYLYMKSASRPNKATAVGGMVMKESNHSWDGADNPFFNGSYTSALTFEEVDYTYNQPTMVNDGDGNFYATVYLPFPMQIPEGVDCYRGVAERSTSLSLSRMNKNVGDVVPAGGYVLYSEQEWEMDRMPIHILPAGSTLVAEEGSNIFTGSTADTDSHQMYLELLKGRNPYVLANKKGVVGFYRYLPSTEDKELYPKGKAIYLAGTDALASGFTFDFGDIVEAINTLKSEGTDSILFDLQGRVLSPLKGDHHGQLPKGIVIKDNRKVIIR